MRPIYIFSILALITLSACSTNRAVQAAFSKYRNTEGVTAITVPGWVISLGMRIADLPQEERKLIGQIDKVKVLTVEDPTLNQYIDFHQEYYQRILAQKGYEDLVLVRENQENVSILGRFRGETLRELIVLVGGNENTLVYLRGKFEPSALQELIDKTEKPEIRNL
jgi:hypothetical protein